MSNLKRVTSLFLPNNLHHSCQIRLLFSPLHVLGLLLLRHLLHPLHPPIFPLLYLSPLGRHLHFPPLLSLHLPRLLLQNSVVFPLCIPPCHPRQHHLIHLHQTQPLRPFNHPPLLVRCRIHNHMSPLTLLMLPLILRLHSLSLYPALTLWSSDIIDRLIMLLSFPPSPPPSK